MRGRRTGEQGEQGGAVLIVYPSLRAAAMFSFVRVAARHNAIVSRYFVAAVSQGRSSSSSSNCIKATCAPRLQMRDDLARMSYHCPITYARMSSNRCCSTNSGQRYLSRATCVLQPATPLKSEGRDDEIATAPPCGSPAAVSSSSTPPLVPQVHTPLLMLDPAQTMDKLVATAGGRADRPTSEMLTSAALAGAYLSFGGCLYVMVAGGSVALQETVPGLHALMSALVFPTGLSLILLTGTDLLTSNMMYGALPFLSHPDRSTGRCLRDWGRLMATSFAGNFAGSLAVACAAAAWLFPVGTPGAAFAVALATKKTGLTLAATIGKATCANWLVNLAVFQATTATSTGGKLAGCWMPVTAFVALGLEHSVANMFTLPLGIMSGADFTFAHAITSNIIPVCIGNALGASLFVAGAQWYASGGARRPARG